MKAAMTVGASALWQDSCIWVSFWLPAISSEMRLWTSTICLKMFGSIPIEYLIRRDPNLICLGTCGTFIKALRQTVIGKAGEIAEMAQELVGDRSEIHTRSRTRPCPAAQ
jgi:hypothetical protein